jgi:hypothetical protein
MSNGGDPVPAPNSVAVHTTPIGMMDHWSTTGGSISNNEWGNTHSVWRTIQLPVTMTFSHVSPTHTSTACVSHSVSVLMAHSSRSHVRSRGCLQDSHTHLPGTKEGFPPSGRGTHSRSFPILCEQTSDLPIHGRAVMVLVGKHVLESSGQPDSSADPNAPPACTAMIVKSNKFLTTFQWMWRDERVPLARTTQTKGVLH